MRVYPTIFHAPTYGSGAVGGPYRSIQGSGVRCFGGGSPESKKAWGGSKLWMGRKSSFKFASTAIFFSSSGRLLGAPGMGAPGSVRFLLAPALKLEFGTLKPCRPGPSDQWSLDAQLTLDLSV